MTQNWWNELWATIRETIHLRRTRERQAATWLQRYRRKHGRSPQSDQQRPTGR